MERGGLIACADDVEGYGCKLREGGRNIDCDDVENGKTQTL